MNLWKLKQPVHVSWLLAITCVGIIVGVIGAQQVSDWFSSVSWMIGGTIIVAGGLWRRRVYMLPPLLIAGLLIGLWRGSIDQRELMPYHRLIGHHVSVTGVVSEDTDLGKDNETLLRLYKLRVDSHPLAGNLWVSTKTSLSIKRSDEVTVRGRLSKGFGSFAATLYQAKLEQVKRPHPGDVALQLRDGFSEKVRTVIPEPEASLGLGYLLGQRRALPPELDQTLKIAGLTHVVVASGYNLTILVRLARRAFSKVSKYLAALSSSAMIIGFMAVTGLSPSMVRAGLVAGLSLLAWYYGRRFHPCVLLPFAAAVTLLLNPSYGWNDLGWQLSFAAFAGVMIIAPLAQAFFFGDKKPGAVRQILGETIAAQLVTLPILLMAFGQLSNVAVIANLLILPFVPLAMLLVFATGILALLIPTLASLFGDLATALLQYMVTIAEYVSKLEWAQTTLQLSWWMAVAYYVILAGLCVVMWRMNTFDFRSVSLVE